MKYFKYIDLFSGIGGFHLAMDSLGGKCVFASELDTHARKTYEHNFQKVSPKLFKSGNFNDDIRNINPDEIPDFDVLCAGFPCQPFSQAGYKRGFSDNHKSERGNLFFNIVDIIEAKRPKAFFLENVRGIISHDKGKTFKIIREILEEELGYSFYYKVIKASKYGLPQLRPRAFMIGFRDEGIMRSFEFPPEMPLKFNMSDVWEGDCSREIGFTIRVGGRGSNINDRRNWDAYLVDGEVKKLSLKEAIKMQGFPSDFEFPVAKTQAMKQLGNSVAVDAVKACADSLLTHMKTLTSKEIIRGKKNKGEWTELLSFMKLINDEGFGIKSYLGSKPTLLNASGNTNFIYKATGISAKDIDSVNNIMTRIKLKDRIKAIHDLGGSLVFHKAEKEILAYNLKAVDSAMPEIISVMLCEFFVNRTSSVKQNIANIHREGKLNKSINYGDLAALEIKIKNLLVAVLLGFFPGKKWDGNFESNGTIIVKDDGEQVGFHIIDLVSLKEYLFENIKFDTPSMSRHRYGSLFVETGGTVFFKLNLQLRF
jgi:site-specific DNA-cytosine methylase